MEEIKDEEKIKKKIGGRRKVYRQSQIIKPIPKSFAVTYKVPLAIYEKYKDELSSETIASTSKASARQHKCHQKTHDNFNTGETPNCSTYLLVAAKQAFEDRDYKTLIKILEKSLNVRDIILKQQILAYMEIAGFKIPEDEEAPYENDISLDNF